MASHHQLLYHIVFGTKHREPLLADAVVREHVHRYLVGIARNLDGVALRIGGYFEHVHLLVRIPAKLAVSDFVGKLKSNSSREVNREAMLDRAFHWQDGFGAFTVSQSQSNRIIQYIDRQMITRSIRSSKNISGCSRSIRSSTTNDTFGNSTRCPSRTSC